MATATHLFHDDLYIDLINGTGTDIDFSLIVREHKARLDTFYIQQFIGSLGPDDGRTGQIICGTDGNCEVLLIDLSLADRIRLGLILQRIFSEQLTHTGHIRTVSSQKCCCLKGTHTRFCHKVAGIHHNSGEHAVCLLRSDLHIVIGILQNLRYHLRCGRSIRLHIRESCILNGIRTLSVMIQHHNGFAHAQQVGTLCYRRFVNVNHYQYAVATGRIQCLLTVDYHIFIIRIPLKQINNGLNGGRNLIQHNMCFSFQILGDSIDSHSSTEAVCIRHPVSHNQNQIFARDNLSKCMCLDACLHPGILFHLLTLSAVIGDTLRSLDNCLIASSSQRKVNCISCKLIVLGIRKPIQSDTDTDGYRHLVTDIHGLNLFQQVKPALL